jgi:hypothetical protein
MPAQGLVISCSSTPIVVAGSLTPEARGGHGYIKVRLKPLTGTAYLGDSGVTTAGFPLSTADAPMETTLVLGETLWAASSSGAAVTVGVLRVNETT